MPEPLVHGYQIGSSESIGDPLATLTEGERAAYHAGSYRPRDRTFDNPGWGWTAGSAISTPRDLQVWSTELVIGSLLTDAMQQRRLDEIPDPGIPDFGPGGGYGNGLARRDGIYWHDGQLPGYSTYVGNDLATGKR